MKPYFFNVFKPAGMTSYDVIRFFKRHLPRPFFKIGHIGTLDPFASGVLLIGINGATKLNDYIHSDLTKTYLAIGKLGVSTDTGDMTSKILRKDESDFFYNTIASFSKDFIQEELRKKFEGVYMQSPHKFSASKYEGKKLYEWARDGVEIKKEKKERMIYSIDVVKYNHPYLSIRVKVSSGTYVRSLFEDFALHLGTYGTLSSLVREKIGNISIENSEKKMEWMTKPISPEKILNYDCIKLDEVTEKKYLNGIAISVFDKPNGMFWIYGKELIGLAEVFNGKIIQKCRF